MFGPQTGIKYADYDALALTVEAHVMQFLGSDELRGLLGINRQQFVPVHPRDARHPLQGLDLALGHDHRDAADDDAEVMNDARSRNGAADGGLEGFPSFCKSGELPACGC